MPGQDFIELPDAPPTLVALAPAHHALHSLLLLTRAENVSGFHEWVTRTLDLLTPAEQAHHKLVIIGFFHALIPQRDWPSFPAYVDHLAALDPKALRDKMLNEYIRISCLPSCSTKGVGGPVELESIVESAESYLDFLRTRFSADIIDQEMEMQAFSYVADPLAMQELIVSHLRKMWDTYLSAEWERVEPMLRDSERAFRQIDFSTMSRLEAAQLITNQEIEGKKWQEWFEKVERVVFVPSAHVGPYLGKLWGTETLWVLFGARIPEGVQYHAPDLSRVEIVVRLNALADDTRLRLLKLVAEEGEQRSQDIMSRLGLSQSATSRHMKQLSATGYLNERRCEGAKCYALNAERIRDTLSAVSTFLLK